eukprot:GSA120T00011948001.1
MQPPRRQPLLAQSHPPPSLLFTTRRRSTCSGRSIDWAPRRMWGNLGRPIYLAPGRAAPVRCIFELRPLALRWFLGWAPLCGSARPPRASRVALFCVFLCRVSPWRVPLVPVPAV